MSKRIRWIVFPSVSVALLAGLLAMAGKESGAKADAVAHRLLESWEKSTPPSGYPPFWSIAPDPGEMPGYVITIDKRTPGSGVAMFQKRKLWHGFYQEHVLALRQCESNNAVWQLSNYGRCSFRGITFWRHGSTSTMVTNLP